MVSFPQPLTKANTFSKVQNIYNKKVSKEKPNKKAEGLLGTLGSSEAVVRM